MPDIIKVVPNQITSTFESLKPTHSLLGTYYRIKKESDKRFFPPEFMKKLYLNYILEYGTNERFLIPRLYQLFYRIVLKVPTLKQMNSVFNNDSDLQKACCFDGYNNSEINKYHNMTSLFGMNQLHTNLMQLSKLYKEALHNLTDELNYKKITIDGLVPSVWVEYYRKPRTQVIPVEDNIIDDWEYTRICSNYTGIDVIDEITSDIPFEYRSDIRQDAALKCLEIGLDNLTEDGIANIVRGIQKKSKGEYWGKFYKEKSLFSKPFRDSKTELWEIIADTSADFINEIENE